MAKALKSNGNKRLLTLVDKFQTKIGRKIIVFLIKLNQEICVAKILQKI